MKSFRSEKCTQPYRSYGCNLIACGVHDELWVEGHPQHVKIVSHIPAGMQDVEAFLARVESDLVRGLV